MSDLALIAWMVAGVEAEAICLFGILRALGLT